MDKPYILCINEGIHEASVTLLHGMELRVFVEQERHSRHRHHTYGVVSSDLLYKVLDTEGICPEQIDYFCYCNLTPFEEISVGPNTGLLTLKQIVGAKDFDLRWKHIKLLANNINHHQQHCAASFYSSGFDSALGLVVDGSGDLNDSITLFKCSKDNGIIELKKYDKKYSLGDFYADASCHMRLGNNSEGKLMGLASFWKSDIEYSNFDKETKEMKNPRLWYWYEDQNPYPFEFFMKDTIHYIRAAGEVQKIFTNTILDIIEYLKSFDPNETNLVIAGGCMLNCSCNAEIEKQGLFKNIYCFPATNDAGISLGAAYLYAADLCKDFKPKRIEHVYLGVDYPRSKTLFRLKQNSTLLTDYQQDEIVDLLCKNQVIAWYQGRSEAGPRALGHRSLLASPCDRQMLENINDEIKERESFRPLAPIVLDKYYLDIFDDPNPENLTPFMLKNVIIKPEWRHKIPAVCHIDYTARPQYLKREVNPELYDLIEAFYKKTGIPLLINTSLNGKGEPIVETADDLLKFLYSHENVFCGIYNAKKKNSIDSRKEYVMAMVQYGLWPNCTNHCDFCLLLDRDYKTIDERLNMLISIKENIKTIDWKDKFRDGISLLGGEIYYTESEDIKNEFLNLIEAIIKIIIIPNKTTVYSTVTNGIYDSKILLEPTLDLFKQYNVIDQVDINFSWDLKYRFHNEESLNSMIKNVNLVYEKYKLKPRVQTCLTQYLIDAHLNNTFNLIDYQKEHFPNTTLALLYPHKINTGKDVPDFFFTRESFFNFIKYLKSINQNDLIQHLIQSVINSSQFKYTGLWERDTLYKNDKDAIELNQQPTLENKQNLTECGHSDLYRCYSNSDKCMLCDLLKVI